MTEIEKADFAIWLVKKLLFIDKKILAVACVKRLYDCGIADAKKLVENIGICADREFLEYLGIKPKESNNAESSVPNTRPE